VTPKYSFPFTLSRCPKQITLSAKRVEKLGKKLKNLQLTQGFSPDPALNTLYIKITQLEQYRRSIVNKPSRVTLDGEWDV
jgi:hypothetical protein